MAIATSNLVHDNSTLANFQSWAQFIFNAFSVTAGWTQAADTGQTAPSAAASVGSFYFIFKMADALQATCPVFVKISYGTNGTTVQFAVQVGQGSNGSGTLTGAVSNNVGNSLTTNEGVSTFPCYASGDSGSIRIFMWQSGSQNTGFLFGVERSKNASGVNTAEYVTFLAADANSNSGNFFWAWQHLLAGNVNPQPTLTGSGVAGWPIIAPPPGGTLNFNGTTAAIPFLPLPGKPGNPLLDWAGTAYGDVVEGQTNITVSIYGANHNYISTKQNLFSNLYNQGFKVALLMRYE